MIEEEWRRHPLALDMSEAVLQARVEELLGWHQWDLIYHTHDSRRSQGGFPDVCAVRSSDGRLLFAELKKQKDAYPTTKQRAWATGLQAVYAARGAVEVIPVWRPSHFLSGDIDRYLR